MILHIWNLAPVSPRTISSFSFAVVNVPSTGFCFRTHPLFSHVQFQFQFIVLPQIVQMQNFSYYYSNTKGEEAKVKPPGL